MRCHACQKEDNKVVQYKGSIGKVPYHPKCAKQVNNAHPCLKFKRVKAVRL